MTEPSRNFSELLLETVEGEDESKSLCLYFHSSLFVFFKAATEQTSELVSVSMHKKEMKLTALNVFRRSTLEPLPPLRKFALYLSENYSFLKSIFTPPIKKVPGQCPVVTRSDDAPQPHESWFHTANSLAALTQNKIH